MATHGHRLLSDLVHGTTVNRVRHELGGPRCCCCANEKVDGKSPLKDTGKHGKIRRAATRPHPQMASTPSMSRATIRSRRVARAPGTHQTFGCAAQPLDHRCRIEVPVRDEHAAGGQCSGNVAGIVPVDGERQRRRARPNRRRTVQRQARDGRQPVPQLLEAAAGRGRWSAANAAWSPGTWPCRGRRARPGTPPHGRRRRCPRDSACQSRAGRATHWAPAAASGRRAPR